MANRSALQAVQNAVYATLNADATLANKVFDEPPQEQALPFVVIGDAIEEPNDTFGRYGKAVTFTVTAWSTYAGYKQAQDYHAIALGLLNRATISVTNYDSVVIRFQRATAARDGLRRYVQAEYLFTLQETS